MAGTRPEDAGLPQALAATALSLLLIAGVLMPWSFSLGQVAMIAAILHLPPVLLAILFAAYLKRRLGGITGDTIGATIELAEITAFLNVLVFWKFIV